MPPHKSAPSNWKGAARIIASGGAARLISLPLGAFCTAITAYISIRYVGSEYYGYISLVATLFLLIPYADFGLGVAVINATSRVAPGMRPTATDLLTIWRVFVRIALIALGLAGGSFLIAAVDGWTKVLSLPSSLVGANYATAFTLSVFFLAMPLGVGQRILVGLGRVGEMAIISISTPLVTMAVTWLLVITGAPGIFLTVAPAIGIFAASAISFGRGLRHLDIRFVDLRHAAAVGSRERLAHSALSYFIVTSGSAIAMHSHRIILSYFSTPSELSAYSLMSQMYVPVLSVITIGCAALWPAYKQRAEDAPTLWKSALKTLFAVGLLLGLGFGLLSLPAANLISSGDIQPGILLAACYTALIVAIAILQGSQLLLTDERGLRFQAYCVIAFMIATVGLSIVLAPPLGAAGPVLATVVTLSATMLLPITFRANKSLKN